MHPGTRPSTARGHRAAACVVAVGLLLSVAGCGAPGASGRGDRSVVAAFFPLAATARALVGPGVAVHDLTPPGVEPHDLELTTDDMDEILDARLVVLMGKGFQPAIESGASRRDGPTLRVLDRLHAGDDPHVWLDPVLMRRVVGLVAAGLGRAVPGRHNAIRARAGVLRADLSTLDREFRSGLAHCRRHVVVTAHAAFAHLATRYGLRQHAIAGISPEQEPDPRRLAALADLVRRDHLTTVFTERLVSSGVADTLARDAHVHTAVLDPIESPAHGTTFRAYLRSMRGNLAALRRALGCR
jgi:zinc transport system substrate-binding protein